MKFVISSEVGKFDEFRVFDSVIIQKRLFSIELTYCWVSYIITRQYNELVILLNRMNTTMTLSHSETKKYNIVNRFILVDPVEVKSLCINLEQYIWIDPLICYSDKLINYLRFNKQLRWKMFQQVIFAQKYVQSNPSRILRIITSLKVAEQVCDLLGHHENVKKIYILSPDKAKVQLLKAKFMKVKLISVQMQQSFKQIRYDVRLECRFQSSLKFHLINNFDRLHSIKERIILYAMLNIKDDMNKEDMIKLIKQVHPSALDQFIQYYPSENAENIMKWFSGQSYYVSLLTQLIHAQVNPQITPYIRKAFTDLHTSIKSIYDGQKKQKLTVYKGTTISDENLKLFTDNINGYVEVYDFVTTTKNYELARSLIPQHHAVFFRIQIEDSEGSQFEHGYADISAFSEYPKENQIVFNALNVYKIISVTKQAKYTEIVLRYGFISSLLKKKNNELASKQKQFIKNYIDTIKNTKHITNQGSIYRYQSQQQAALTICQKILSKQASNDEIAGNIHEQMGINYLELNQPQKALISLDKAYSLKSLNLPTAHEDIFLNAFNRAKAYLAIKNYKEALICLERVVEYRKQKYGLQSVSIAQAYTQVGICYDGLMNKSQACNYLTKSVHIYQIAYEKEDVNTIAAYIQLGDHYDFHYNYYDSLIYYLKGLENYQKIYGKQHVITLALYDKIAKGYFKKGQLDNSLKYHQITLSMRRQYNISANNLQNFRQIAEISLETGAYDRALEYFLKVLKIQNQSSSTGETIDTYFKIGKTYKYLRLQEQAMKSLSRYLEMHKDSLRESTMNTVQAYRILADIQKHQGQMCDSYKINAIDLELLLLSNTNNSKRKAQLLEELAEIYLSQKNLQSALHNYLLAVAERQNSEKQQSLFLVLAACYTKIAIIYSSLSDLDNALIYYKKALSCYESNGHQKIDDICESIAKILKVKNSKSALPFWIRTAQIRQKTHGKNYIGLIQLYFQICQIYYSQKDYQHVLQFKLLQAPIFQQNIDKKLVRLYQEIAVLYSYLNQINNAVKFYQKQIKISQDLKCQDLQTASSLIYCAKYYQQQAKYLEALSDYQQSIKLKIKFKDQNYIELADEYYWIAKILQKINEHVRAQSYLQKSMAVLLSNHKQKSVQYSLRLYESGRSYNLMKQYHQAISILSIAIKIQEQILQRQHLARVQSYHQISLSFQNTGDKEMELKYRLLAFNEISQYFGQQSLETATLYQRIGQIYESMLQSDKALQFYLMAVQLKINELSTEHIQILELYIKIAGLYSTKEYLISYDYYLMALNVSIKLHGQRNIKTSNIHVDLARIAATLGNHQEVINHYETCVKYLEKELGMKNVLVGEIYRCLSKLLVKRKDYKAALKCQLKLAEHLKIVNLEEGEQNANCYHNLYQIFVELKDLNHALRYELQSSQLMYKCPSVNLSNQYKNIAQIYKAFKDDKEEALTYYLKCLQIRQVLMLQDIQTADVSLQIAVIYESFRDYTNALKYYLKVLNIRQITSAGQNNTAEIYQKVSQLYLIIKDYQKCLEYSLVSIQMFETLSDKSNMASLKCYQNAGIAYRQLRHYNLSLKCYYQSLEICTLLGSQHKVNVMQCIGEIYCEMHRFSHAYKVLKKVYDMRKIEDGNTHQKTLKVLHLLMHARHQINE